MVVTCYLHTSRLRAVSGGVGVFEDAETRGEIMFHKNSSSWVSGSETEKSSLRKSLNSFVRVNASVSFSRPRSIAYRWSNALWLSKRVRNVSAYFGSVFEKNLISAGGGLSTVVTSENPSPSL